MATDSFKRINQETFEEVVKENVEDFEMGLEEALGDAVEQFKSQKVELSNIVMDFQLDPTTGEFTHDILTKFKQLEDQYEDDISNSSDSLALNLAEVGQLCSQSLSHRCLLVKKAEPLPFLVKLCEESGTNLDRLSRGLSTLTALLEGQPDLVSPNLMEYYMGLVGHAEESIAHKALRLIYLSCVLHESNRQTYVELKLIPLLAKVLQERMDASSLVKEACLVLRSLTLDDDPRVPFGKAHEHAKMIVTEGNALDLLMQVCEKYGASDPTLIGEVFTAIAALAVRNEFCQRIMDLGGLRMMLDSLAANAGSRVITNQIIGVLIAVARNDEAKQSVIKLGGIPLLIAAMDQHSASAPIAENGCACLTTIALRNTGNASQIMRGGGHQAVVQCMQAHPASSGVQKQACMALRNFVARMREFVPAVLSLGAEDLIRTALQTHASCADEAKAALRDLDCKVHLEERWKGEKGSIQQ